jgi:predicted RNA-binding Zn ribbon-like protein
VLDVAEYLVGWGAHGCSFLAAAVLVSLKASGAAIGISYLAAISPLLLPLAFIALALIVGCCTRRCEVRGPGVMRSLCEDQSAASTRTWCDVTDKIKWACERVREGLSMNEE